MGLISPRGEFDPRTRNLAVHRGAYWECPVRSSTWTRLLTRQASGLDKRPLSLTSSNVAGLGPDRFAVTEKPYKDQLRTGVRFPSGPPLLREPIGLRHPSDKRNIRGSTPRRSTKNNKFEWR